ncbi:nuclear transport factor 2 family protein [Epilithonimonas mollis]|uniref:SnoaL-like domain-containing protein n=1 Tax=Epilithonimonas mollis TaxID=216903 RepID=A0A1M6T528_9FLAO|nr:nuclear transport factor 2 family protein [Epilithonimonas mollis]SHK52057.1 conserved hypothetical protein, steroid delta-isomerase-related [Epilithonimonas mollis]
MKIFRLSAALLMLSALTVGCSNCDTKGNPENEQLVKHYFELFNKHQWKELSELYAEHAEFKDPSFGTGTVKQSRPDFVKKYTELNQMFPNLKDEVKHIYVSGDKHIIVEFVSTGTAPDQSGFELPICTVFTIENGKITKDFTYYDNFDEPK